jgi:hypothetical protein
LFIQTRARRPLVHGTLFHQTKQKHIPLTLSPLSRFTPKSRGPHYQDEHPSNIGQIWGCHPEQGRLRITRSQTSR